MNLDRCKGIFMQFEGAIREQWGKLSSDDIDLIAGQREQLIGRIQERYGIAKEAAEKEVEEWWKRVGKATPHSA
jgi:uncharacterized protein YjbJ (UPF0337 family)